MGPGRSCPMTRLNFPWIAIPRQTRKASLPPHDRATALAKIPHPCQLSNGIDADLGQLRLRYRTHPHQSDRQVVEEIQLRPIGFGHLAMHF